MSPCLKTTFLLTVGAEQNIKIGLKPTQKANKERAQKLTSKRIPTVLTVMEIARKLKSTAGNFYF